MVWFLTSKNKEAVKQPLQPPLPDLIIKNWGANTSTTREGGVCKSESNLQITDIFQAMSHRPAYTHIYIPVWDRAVSCCGYTQYI
jgi:hypothetical protein